jgi:hypothetical protein
MPPGNHRDSDLRRTCSERRKVRDPRTPGRMAISAVAAGGSSIVRASIPQEGVPCQGKVKRPLAFRHSAGDLTGVT